MDRRKFLEFCLKSGLGLSGMAVYLKYLGGKGFSLDSILERKESILLGEKFSDFKIQPIKYITGKNSDKDQYPSIAIDDNDTIWTAFTSLENDKETIKLSLLSKEAFSTPIDVSTEKGFEYDPQILNTKYGLAIVWTSKRRDNETHILLRFYENGKFGNEIKISEDGNLNWKPAIANAPDGSVWIAWERKVKGYFEIAARNFQDGSLSPVVTISSNEGMDARRPAAVCNSKGDFFCAYDVYKTTGNNDIYLAVLGADKKINQIQITRHPASDISPSVDVDTDDNIWVVWHSNRKGSDESDIPRWFELRCVKGEDIYAPIAEPMNKNLSLEGENQSIEFPQVICCPDGKILVLCRLSHNFCMQYYYKDKWSPLYRFPVDGWGGRGKFCYGVLKSDGGICVTRRESGSNAYQEISGLKLSGEKPSLVIVDLNKEGEANHLKNIQEKITYEPKDKFNYYFGELHGHTWMSDGINDLDEYYLWYRDVMKYDFCTLTDHDDFVQNFLLPSEWEEQKVMTEHYNKEGEFVTLFGQEWTTTRTPKGFGHKNIYHIDPKMPLLKHTDEKYNTTQKIFEKIKELGAFAIPHHIGWTGVDWENHDAVAQPLVEIVSNHGAFEYMGNKPIYHRGGLAGCFVMDGLNRGLKFGIVGGSDSHGLIWHHKVGWKRDCHGTGLTCVLADKLTREAIFDALKKRRCYATSGIKMKIDFAVNGDTMMGEEIKLEKDKKVQISAHVVSPEDLQWIVIVKDGKDLNTFGGEAYSSKVYFTDDKLEHGTHYYYLRVITENGNMAWTSPVWVDVV